MNAINKMTIIGHSYMAHLATGHSFFSTTLVTVKNPIALQWRVGPAPLMRSISCQQHGGYLVAGFAGSRAVSIN